MQIRTRVKDGNVEVEVVDPSDGTVTHYAALGEAEQITVTATKAHSPADIEFGEVELITEPEEVTEVEEAEPPSDEPDDAPPSQEPTSRHSPPIGPPEKQDTDL